MAKENGDKSIYRENDVFVSNECFLTAHLKSILSNRLLNESRAIYAYFSHSHRNAPCFLKLNEIEMETIRASTFLKDNKVSLNFILLKWTFVLSGHRDSTSRHFWVLLSIRKQERHKLRKVHATRTILKSYLFWKCSLI